MTRKPGNVQAGDTLALVLNKARRGRLSAPADSGPGAAARDALRPRHAAPPDEIVQGLRVRGSLAGASGFLVQNPCGPLTRRGSSPYPYTFQDATSDVTGSSRGVRGGG